ncbi:MAG TPA: hypothetical protein ENK57_06995 [Polyangiaceae bacterium]|nr:hypothetical protein [Polyangiaceae bacterium]
MTPLGLDLGTAFCRAFTVKPNGDVVAVVGSDGAWIPSAVHVRKDGKIEAGVAAFEAATEEGAPPFTGTLRVLGRRYYSPETDWLRTGLAGELVPSPNGDAWIRFGDLEVAPEQLIAALLREVMDRAVDVLGSRPTTAAIAIPNAFDQLQRRALVAACELANVPLRTMVQSSSAFAAGMPPQPGTRRVAVLDFGAGYLDVALLLQSDKGWTVEAGEGDGLLGGMDFDRRIVGLLPPEATERAPIAELCLRAEQLRHVLTESDRAMWGGKQQAHAITRAEHDTAIAEELECLGPPCAQILADVGLGTDDVDELILVGGLARVPTVRQHVAKLFRQIPVDLGGSSDLVALGALRTARGTRPSQLSTRTIGVKVRGGLMSAIVPRGRPIPWQGGTQFGAPSGGQTRIVFEVYEGDDGEAAHNLYLGSFVVEDVQQGVAPRISFGLDKNGVLQVGSWSTGTRGGDVRFNWAGGYPVARGHDATVVDSDYARVPQSSTSAVQEREDPTSVFHRPGRADHSHVRPSTKPPPSSVEEVEPLPSDDALVGTVVGGRYQIDAVVAEGAMGRVYVATHQLLGRRFAVKVLHPELARNEELAMRFLREAQAAARIESDHVVDIVDFGRLDDGTGYFVMEYLDGLTLGQLIKDRGRIDAELTRTIGSQIAHGIAAAHAIDIVHRDLKPDNIALVSRPGSTFFPKILDFGIAKHPTSSSEGPITMAGSLVGSPYYMAPEQIIGGTICPQTDIYAMGIMLFEMLTGAPPYLADSVAHVLQQHVDATPPTVVERGGACPPHLENVIRRCLEKRVEARYATARDLIAELAAAS